jgi:hypothetical protein
VLLTTGHRLKTAEALGGSTSFDTVIDGRLSELGAFWRAREGAAA